jgi:thiamine biosynthesis protein ThiS
MNITLNGHPETIPDDLTVEGFLSTRDLQPIRVAVEINEELVPRKTFAETKIQPGDRIEVVTFVGGG